MRKEKGITLIALVITIIVMLILVAVTISVAINGELFGKATEATKKTQIEADREELQAAVLDTIHKDDPKPHLNEVLSKLDTDNTDGEYWQYNQSSSSFTKHHKNGDENEFTVTISANGGFSVIYGDETPNAGGTETEVASGPGLFIYEITGVNTASIVDINYDYIYKDIPGYNDSDYNSNSESSSGSDIDFSEAEEAEELYLTNVTIPSKVKLDSNGKYDEEGTEFIVTGIEYRVFEKCGYLTSVIIPNTVTSIGNSVFYDCRSLTSITIPDGVTSIGEYAFYQCSSLTSIELPNSITSIGQTAFSGCSSLTRISLPENMSGIDTALFYGCRSLTEIHIPSGVSFISWSAFQYCESLTEITIPSSVTNIIMYAFDHCTNLGTVTYKGIDYTDKVELENALTSSGVSIGTNAFSNTALTNSNT